MSRDGDAGMDVKSGGRASGQLDDVGLAVAAGGSLAGGRALGDRFGSGEAFEDLPSPGGLGIRRAVVAAPLTCTSGEIPTYPVLDGHGHVSQFRQRGSPSRLKEDVKGRPARILGEPGIALLRSVASWDLREDPV
jgi:hypothetical protein